MARANEKLLNVGVLLSDGASFLMGGTLLLALNYAVMRPRWKGFYPGGRTARQGETGEGWEAPAGKTVGKRCPRLFEPVYGRKGHAK